MTGGFPIGPDNAGRTVACAPNPLRQNNVSDPAMDFNM